MPRAFLSVGSNLGDRLALLREAVQRLARLEAVQVVGASRLYEAEPWESEPGRTRDETTWYLNCVVAVETTLPPHALLERVQAVETALGRTRPPGTPEARRFAARSSPRRSPRFEPRLRNTRVIGVSGRARPRACRRARGAEA